MDKFIRSMLTYRFYPVWQSLDKKSGGKKEILTFQCLQVGIENKKASQHKLKGFL